MHDSSCCANKSTVSIIISSASSKKNKFLESGLIRMDGSQIRNMAQLFEECVGFKRRSDRSSDSFSDGKKDQGDNLLFSSPGDIGSCLTRNAEENVSASSSQNTTTKSHEVDDSRLKPEEVTFVYSQDVSPQDIFLGLGLLTPSTSSCKKLRITLRMPEEDAAANEIDAQIESTSNKLELRSPRYRLSLPLPQPADPNTSLHRAQWDAKKRHLIVTVRLRRELDYTNF